jgi:hypothetical protein
MVSTAITVAGVTSSWVTEYTPTVTSTSWMSATSVGMAIFNSNRSAM